MHKKIRDSERFIAIAFLLPALLFLVVFCVYPILYNIVMGFQDMNMMNLRNKAYTFVGLRQYIELFTDKTGVFQRSVFNTFKYTVFSIVFQFSLGFMFALLFAKRFRV